SPPHYGIHPLPVALPILWPGGAGGPCGLGPAVVGGLPGGLWRPLCRGLYLRPCHFGPEQPATALPYCGHWLFYRRPDYGPPVVPLNFSVMKNLLYTIMGGLLGVVLYKSEAASWFRIYEMFRFDAFHMYGIIGSALGLGIILVQAIKSSRTKSIFGDTII